MTLESIRTWTSRALNNYNDKVTANLFVSDDLLTFDNGTYRPCIDGDVLSVQPDGTLQGRIKGTNGPYELATVTTKGLLYDPLEGKAQYLIPYVD